MELDDCGDLGLPNCNAKTDGEFAGTGLADAVEVAFLFIGFLATLYLVIAGIQYALSGGDPNKTRQAKDAIIYALVGMVLSFSMYAIVGLLFGGASTEAGL